MITPLDIQKKEFRRGLRGYREEEVDAFLDQIIEDYENLFRENQALKEKLAMLEQNIGRYREMEEVLKNTMIMAQKNSDELRQNAEKEASLLLDQARLEAEQITREAEQEAAALIQVSEQKASELLHKAEEKVRIFSEEFHQLEKEAQAFKIKLHALLRAQMKMLEADGWDLPVAEESAGDSDEEEIA
ncbi:MAG: DivIVA domain-containing protein [Peptococcaceae bacterium]|mgnify:CR=1 FL=1|nr:DivIVA domain-containing protein [Peptococcaceae bacterium]